MLTSETHFSCRGTHASPNHTSHQLLSFVSLWASSAVSRMCTDVTVIECNAISKIKAKQSAASSLNAKAYEKRTKHHDAARRAGVELCRWWRAASALCARALSSCQVPATGGHAAL